MKAKTLVVLLVVTSILLIYSMICYSLLNKSIEVSTKNIISDYLAKSSITAYEYLKANSTKKDTFQVFVKSDNQYFTFIFELNQHDYQLLKVYPSVPDYISTL